MEAIWMAISPRCDGTRLLATQGTRAPLLKAKLLSAPRHPRALPYLLESLALWQGMPVRAALAVSEQQFSTSLLPDVDDFGRSPLYSLDVVSLRRARRRRDELGGVGEFRDLQQLLLDEVAR